MDITVGDNRGRNARTPSEIPRQGWRDILWRVWKQIGEDNLFIVAAGVSFYAFLALFPALAAMVSLAGLVMEPADVERLVASATGVLPPEALQIIRDQVHEVVTTSNETLGVGLVVSLALALWSATAGIKALMTALNIVYDEQEARGFLRYYATALVLTLGAVVFAPAALMLVAALPVLLERLPPVLGIFLGVVRWLLLGGALLLALAVVYRYAPSRERAQWRWVTWGSAMAMILWLIGSALFSLYVAKFGDYNKTYGALGAIVILLTWFYLSTVVILLGAELNAEMEHQTRADSTVGRPQPLGQRGAQMADTVGESKGNR